ncbi:phytanoyl-CoA dioxygenase family protein [Zavarzinia sp. CC-PAN008]|uniref:phytanoyl-CoA dioxygenase family protein n=1 Tax=Zavarzinia sp. CC-PAN008 TaxID=3243332 RepID=UPI003F746CFF
MAQPAFAPTNPAADPGGTLDLVRNLLPQALVVEVRATLLDLIGAVLGHDPGTDLDTAVDAVVARDRRLLSQVYDAMRETLAFRRVVTAPELVDAVAQRLETAGLGTARLHSPFQHAVFRMDLAGEGYRGFGWHQDYPYNMLCGRSLTAWTPLTDSGPHNGAIDAVPALSDRVWPVEIRFKRNADGSRGRTADAFIAPRFHAAFEAAQVKLSLAPGDVALFGNRVVHRSGHNPGPRHRYSIQVRFGDLLAPEVVARAWANRRVEGFHTFKALHPDLIEFEEEHDHS